MAQAARITIGAAKVTTKATPSPPPIDDEMLGEDDDDDLAVAPTDIPEPKEIPNASLYETPKRDILDRSKPYGTIYSVGKSKAFKARYWQQGRHYNAQGERIMFPGDEEREKELAEERMRTARERAERLRSRAEAVERGEPDPEDLTSPDAINLTMWGEGEVDYLFSYVRRAIEERYHRSVHNMSNALDFLIEQKVVDGRRARKIRAPVRQR